MIPELAMNPLVSRVIALFGAEGDEELDFKQFVQVLSVFSVKGSRAEKVNYAFRIYDIQGDGFVDAQELFTVLKLMVGTNLNDQQMEEIVKQTIIEGDLDGDGKLSQKEFVDLLGEADLEAKLTIRF